MQRMHLMQRINVHQAHGRPGLVSRIQRHRCAGAMVAACIGVLTLLLLVWPMPAVADGGADVRVVGEVTQAPNTSNGYGLYTVIDSEHVAFDFRADDDTEFPNDVIPRVGDQIVARGKTDNGAALRATLLKVIDAGSSGPGDDDPPGDDPPDDDPPGGDSPQQDEWTGYVLSRPGAESPVGEWQIQTEAAVLVVTVDGATRFDRDVPEMGDWVEVRGVVTVDGTVLAKRIRPDDVEGGQVVVRLAASSVISRAFGLEYGLIPLATLLRSGDIYLFQAVDEEEDEAPILAQLASDPRVAWAEYNFTNRVPESEGYKTWGWGGVDPSAYVNQHAFTQVGLPPALDQFTGAGVTVAVLDTGVDLIHPGLLGHLIAGRDMIDDDATAQDEGTGVALGHGTHVAGVVAAVAPAASIMPLRVLDSNGRGNMFTLAYAIEWAADHGADVINLSLGAESDSQVLADSIAAAHAQGIIVVAAAGNLADDVRQFPAAYPDVMGVTAVDAGNVKADFASYGRDWVDMAAPGVGIVSTIIALDGADYVHGYASWSGTSMAVPFVAGAAALAREKMPHAAPTVITTLLSDSAADVDAVNPAYAGELGGLLAVDAALVPEIVDPGPVNPTIGRFTLFLPQITMR